MGRVRRPAEPRVVLSDVAREAGTSEATASRALNDDPRIGEATRASVRAAAARLGYVPNAAARSLRARRTHILGLLLGDLADPVHAQLAAGVEAAAAELGLAVFIMTGQHDPATEGGALRAFVEHRADGIILASCVSDPADVYERVPPEHVVFLQPDYPRLVTVGGALEHGVIRSDDAAGVASVIAALVERGYREIVYVGAGGGASDLTRRAAAEAALDGSVARPLRVLDAGPDGWRDPSAVAAALAADRPEAVVCYDDKLAHGLIEALREWHLDVPADMAVAGFDGYASVGRSRPRLTTVVVPWIDLGHRAVGMLAAAARDGSMPRSETIAVELVVGDTTPPRPAVRGGPAPMAVAGLTGERG